MRKTTRPEFEPGSTVFISKSLNFTLQYTSYECQGSAADKMYVDLQVSLILLGRLLQHSLPSLVILHLTLCCTKNRLNKFIQTDFADSPLMLLNKNKICKADFQSNSSEGIGTTRSSYSNLPLLSVVPY